MYSFMYEEVYDVYKGYGYVNHRYLYEELMNYLF